MREALGLPPVERRIGLAAHDFVAAAGAGEVVLSRAEKDAAGQPDGALALARPPAHPARRRRPQPGPARPSGRPGRGSTMLRSRVPRRARRRAPPLAARPRELSVSDIGLWMKDAYDLYAKRILKLAPLEALEADPGALERGIIVHRVLERFVKAYPDELPEDALPRLLDLGRALFEDFSHRPQVRALWWPRFEQVARWVIAQERARRAGALEIRSEVAGRLELDGRLGLSPQGARRSAREPPRRRGSR